MELVLAIGLLFIASGGVMSIIVSGAGMPIKAQQSGQRLAIAQLFMDQALATNPPSGTGGAFLDAPGYPDYKYQVITGSSSFDPANTTVVQVNVMGPAPHTTVSTLRSTQSATTEDGATLMNKYGCNTCHATGGLYGPDITHDSLRTNRDLRKAQLGVSNLPLADYINESILDSPGFLVPGWEVGGDLGAMANYPSITISDTERQTIVNYLRNLP